MLPVLARHGGGQAHLGPHGQLLILMTVSALNHTLCQGSHAGSLLAATVTSPCPSISVDSASRSHCSTGSGLRSPQSASASLVAQVCLCLLQTFPIWSSSSALYASTLPPVQRRHCQASDSRWILELHQGGGRM